MSEQGERGEEGGGGGHTQTHRQSRSWWSLRFQRGDARLVNPRPAAYNRLPVNSTLSHLPRCDTALTLSQGTQAQGHVSTQAAGNACGSALGEDTQGSDQQDSAQDVRLHWPHVTESPAEVPRVTGFSEGDTGAFNSGANLSLPEGVVGVGHQLAKSGVITPLQHLHRLLCAADL